MPLLVDRNLALRQSDSRFIKEAVRACGAFLLSLGVPWATSCHDDGGARPTVSTMLIGSFPIGFGGTGGIGQVDGRTGAVTPLPNRELFFASQATDIVFGHDGTLYGLGYDNLLLIQTDPVQASSLGALDTRDLYALTTGPRPQSLLAIEDVPFVASYLVEVDLRTHEVTRLRTGNSFDEMTLNPQAPSIVIGRRGDSVYRYNMMTGSDEYLGKTVATRIAFDAHEGLVYGLARLSDELQLVRFDPNTGGETIVGPIGLPALKDIAINPRTSALVALMGGVNPSGDALVAINRFTGRGEILGSWSKEAWNLAWDPHMRQFYISSPTSCCLSKLDPLTGDIVEVGYPGFVGIRSMAYDPRSRKIYGVTILDELILIEPRTAVGTLVGVIPQECHAVAFDPTGADMYGMSSDALFRLDRDTAEILSVMDLEIDGGVSGLAIAPDGRAAYVTLYVGAFVGNRSSELHSIDLLSGDALDIGMTWEKVGSIVIDAAWRCYGGNQSGIVDVDLSSGRATTDAQSWINVQSLSGDCEQALFYGLDGKALMVLDSSGTPIRVVPVVVDGHPDKPRLSSLAYDCAAKSLWGTTNDGILVSIEVKTGRATPITSGVFLDALAAHPTKGMFGASGFALYRVGKDGSLVFVGTFGSRTIDDLEFLPDGRLLAVDLYKGELLELDTDSGAATTIGYTSVGLNSLGAIPFRQSGS